MCMTPGQKGFSLIYLLCFLEFLGGNLKRKFLQRTSKPEVRGVVSFGRIDTVVNVGEQLRIEQFLIFLMFPHFFSTRVCMFA